MTPRFAPASALFAIAVLFSCASALRAEIEFVGIMVTPQKTLFALTDTTTARNDWVAVGGIFAGHKVSEFRAQDDTLALTKGEKTIRIRLKDDAKVQASRVELTGTISLGEGENVEVIRATMQFDQENVFPLKDGMVCRITPKRRDDGTITYTASFERTFADNKRERISVPTIVALAGQPFSMRIGDFGFSFAPRSP